MRDIAQQLLSYEATAVNSSEATTPAFRVLNALRQHLCTLVGVQGCQALFARALILAKAKAPILSAVTVQPNGSLVGLSELHADEAYEAGVVLTAQLLGLLATFIGKDLMLHILMSVWTDFTVPGTRGSREEGL